VFGASILRFKLTRAARKSVPPFTREFPYQNLCVKNEPGVSDLLLRQLVGGKDFLAARVMRRTIRAFRRFHLGGPLLNGRPAAGIKCGEVHDAES
jgi:hypothetical protein